MQICCIVTEEYHINMLNTLNTEEKVRATFKSASGPVLVTS